MSDRNVVPFKRAVKNDAYGEYVETNRRAAGEALYQTVCELMAHCKANGLKDYLGQTPTSQKFIPVWLEASIMRDAAQGRKLYPATMPDIHDSFHEISPERISASSEKQAAKILKIRHREGDSYIARLEDILFNTDNPSLINEKDILAVATGSTTIVLKALQHHLLSPDQQGVYPISRLLELSAMGDEQMKQELTSQGRDFAQPPNILSRPQFMQYCEKLRATSAPIISENNLSIWATALQEPDTHIR